MPYLCNILGEGWQRPAPTFFMRPAYGIAFTRICCCSRYTQSRRPVAFVPVPSGQRPCHSTVRRVSRNRLSTAYSPPRTVSSGLLAICPSLEYRAFSGCKGNICFPITQEMCAFFLPIYFKKGKQCSATAETAVRRRRNWLSLLTESHRLFGGRRMRKWRKSRACRWGGVSKNA